MLPNTTTLQDLMAMTPSEILQHMKPAWDTLHHSDETQKAMAFDFHQTLHALAPADASSPRSDRAIHGSNAVDIAKTGGMVAMTWLAVPWVARLIFGLVGLIVFAIVVVVLALHG